MLRRTLAIVLWATASYAQQPEPRELVRQAFAQDENIFNSVQDYTYTENQVERQYDAKGRVVKTEHETYEVLYLYGRQFFKLVARDGKPLPPKEAKKEEAKLTREAEKRKRKIDAGKPDGDDERAERRKAAREVADAFDFKIAGTEAVAGTTAWMLDATPRKGYMAKTREAKLFAKMSGRLWISQADKSLVRVRAQVDDTMSFGLFLLRLKPGARFEFERIHLAQNVWLPRHLFIKGEAKLGLVKTFRMEVEQNYSDYKKFETETSISIAEPVRAAP